ncbi:hypothetical protein [Bradyrhizobium arachidis]|uniref:hypothetical protein n=1 Tax=Bradyrhizobium arachidis TaxID=858423 RepID=UPI002161EAE1|nr:hypothetical protein [Bradyrhizobium arachidis]UVO28157.1 hypothetical protein KUF59_37755 [Bradyrhizobium arachidis]
MRPLVCGLSLILLLAAPLNAQSDLNDEGLAAQSPAPGITKEELAILLKTEFASNLKRPSPLAFSDDDAKFWAGKAKTAHKNAPVERGDLAKTYDVVVQIGHYPRKTGRTGGQGKFVSEQEIAALVAVGLQQQLAKLKNGKQPFSVLLVGADDYTAHLKSKIFLALHTDAAARQCVVGPSVAYQKIGDASGMHAIALALAITLGKDAERFMNDNYTKDEAGYYAFKQFDTTEFKGLLEMSELTCPDQEKALLERAAALSTNLAYAVQFALRPPRS